MRPKSGHFIPTHPFVVLRDDPNVKIVPPQTGRYLMDASVRFYNAATDEGRITCADCMGPDMRLQDGFRQAGKYDIRNHFRTAHGQRHDPDCLSLTRRDQPEDHTTEINLSKAPVIFINDLPQVLTRNKVDALKRLPRDPLVVKDADGKIRLLDEDLADRRRLNAATPLDIMRLMKARSMTLDGLRGSWIVENNRKTPWEKFFVHSGVGASDLRRQAALAADLLQGVGHEHAVMLHTRLEKSPRYIKGEDGKSPRLRFPMQPFILEGVEAGRDVTIVPFVHVRDKTLFHHFNGLKSGTHKGGNEIFLLALPYLSRRRGQPDVVYMHFEINHEGQFMWKPMAELGREVLSRPGFLAPSHHPSAVWHLAV